MEAIHHAKVMLIEGTSSEQNTSHACNIQVTLCVRLSEAGTMTFTSRKSVIVPPRNALDIAQCE